MGCCGSRKPANCFVAVIYLVQLELCSLFSDKKKGWAGRESNLNFMFFNVDRCEY